MPHRPWRKAALSHTAEIAIADPIWARVRDEAEGIVASEPALASFAYATILSHPKLEDVIVHRLAERLDHPAVRGEMVRVAYCEALADEPAIADMFRSDLQAVMERDPACDRLIEPILYFKGFHAIQTHRLAN